jgi:hypothetical protein
MQGVDPGATETGSAMRRGRKEVSKSIAVLVVILLALANLAPLSSQAQEQAQDYLPPAELIGEGWMFVSDVPITDELSPAFRDVAGGVYAGPAGGRAIIIVYLVDASMTAIRESWQLGNDAFDSMQFQFDTEFDFNREEEIEAMRPAPIGCADTRRTYGIEEIGYNAFDVGLTLCAADPDVMVLALASGTFDEVVSSDVSDRLVELVLADGMSTPEP